MNVCGHGEIVKVYKSLKPKKTMCLGCDSDFYNGYGGNTKECWHFKKAKVALMKFYRFSNSRNWDVKAKTLTCYCGINK